MQNRLELTSFERELVNLKEGVFMTTKTLRNVGLLTLKLLGSELKSYLNGVLETERDYSGYLKAYEDNPTERATKEEPPGNFLTRNRL